MRNSAKKLVSAIIAVTMTASLSITAFAAEYALVPTFNSTPADESSATSSEMTDSIVNAVESAVGEAVDAGSDEDAADVETKAVATVTVASTKNLEVKPTVMKTLAKADNTVLQIVAPKATVSIDSSTIKKARNIDLSMQIVNSKSRTKIDMRSNKNFGCEVKITLTACKMSAAKLKTAHVYCDGEDLGPVELDENGVPVITVTKGGEYVIK